ncbi:MAG: TlpA disulfide reductase family protein [Pirellulales bacterium]
MILSHHVTKQEIQSLCVRFEDFSPEYEEILRKIMAANKSVAAQGIAEFQLAELLLRRSDFRVVMDASPDLDDARLRNMGQRIVSHLKSTNRERDRMEAIELYQDVRQRFGLVSHHESTLARLSEEQLVLLLQEFQGKGELMPDITGLSLRDRRMALSDYRDKVVLVTFWASWCAACLDRVPEENRLAQELGEAGLVILGVNCDSDPGEASAAVSAHDIGFESWWDDPAVTPSIRKRLQITHFPTTFVVDRSGRVRFKNLAGPELRTAIVELLNEQKQ